MKVARSAALGLVASIFWWTAANGNETRILPQSGNWQGFYAGVHAGIGRATTNWTSGFLVDTGDFSGTGTLIGFTIGHNWQAGRWVFGVEGDASSSTMRPITEAGCAGLDCRTELLRFGTLRGRLGYLLTPGLLVYGTAGASIGKFEHGVFGFTTGAATKTGVAYGAGIEKVILQRWTAKAEYIYLDNDGGQACDPAFCGSVVQSKFDAHIFRLGLNHRFGAPGIQQMAAARFPGWNGYYASAIFGYGRGKTEWSDPGAGATSGEFDGKSAAVGFGAGYNWQNGRWVLGLEGDAVLTRIKAVSSTPFCLCFSAETEIPHLFTARGRTGYLVAPNTLLFVTGGVAAASLKFGNVNQGTSNAIEIGSVVGAGIEVQATRDWSIKSEYLLASFNASQACGAVICAGALYSDYVRVHMMRLALNRYF
jgi:outer membrane immunogenic protein